MKVSLTDACRLLGQSARQVRYRIRTGDLVATKESALGPRRRRGGRPYSVRDMHCATASFQCSTVGASVKLSYT